MSEAVSVSRVTTPVLSDRTCPLARFRDLVFIMATVSCVITTVELVPGVFLAESLLILAGAISLFRLIANQGVEARFPIHWSLVVLVAGMALACFSMLFHGGGLGEIRSFISHWGLRAALMIATVLIFADSTQARRILGFAATLLVVSTALVAILFVTWTGDLGVLRRSGDWPLNGLEWLRTLTGIGNGNAGWIARTVIVVLPLAVWHQRRSPSRMFGLIVCAGLAVILCRSRTGMVLFGFQVLALGVFMMPRRHVTRLILVAMLVSVGVLGLSQVQNRMGKSGVAGSPLRTTLAEVSMPLIIDRPLMGHGAGEGPDLVNLDPRIQEQLKKPGMPPAVMLHNHWLSVSLEYGIPAATLYLLVPLLLVLDGFNHGLKSHRPDRDLVFALAVSIWSIFIFMQFDLIFRLSVIWIMFGAMIAILGGCKTPISARRLVNTFLATEAVRPRPR